MDEKLIVEIAGDASKYAKMLDEAKAKTESSGEAISSAVDKSTSKTSESFEKAVEIAVKYAQKIRELQTELEKLKDKKAKASDEADKLGDKILNVGQKMETLGRRTKEAGEALSKLTAGFSLQETFEAFNRQEKAEKLLEAALRSQKQNVRELSEEYKRYAKEIQNVTTYGDQLVLELAQQASSFGLNEHQTKRAVQGAIGLAEATGRSTREVIKATVKLEAGSTEMLQEYMPTLLKITDKTEKVAKAHELLGQMFDVARESAKTSAGTLKQLDNSWTDFKETIGKVIAERLEPVIKLLKDLSDLFLTLPTWVRESIATFLILITTTGLLLTSIGAITIAFGTFGVILESIIGKAALATAGMTALKVVLVVGVAYAAYQAGKAIGDVDEQLRKLNETVEQSKEFNDKWANKFTDATSKIMRDIQNIDGRFEKSRFLEGKLTEAKKEMEGYQKLLKGSQDEVDELNIRWNRWTGNKVLETTIRNTEDFKRKLDAAKIRIDLIREAIEKLNNIELDLKLTEDVKKLKDELKLQIDTIGMSSEELRIYDLQIRGADQSVISFMRSQMKLRDALKENNDMYNSIQTRTKDLEREIIIKVNSNDLTQGQKEVKRLNLLLDETRKKDELATNPYSAAVRAGQVQAIINKYERLSAIQDKVERRNELMKRGMEVMKHLDPVEDYRVSVDELTNLLEVGAINWTLYNKGIDQAKKKFDDAVLSSVKLKESLGNLNAAKFGSAEAQDRIDKFNESLQNQVKQYKELSKERDRLNKLSFNKMPQDLKDNPFLKNVGKEIGSGLGNGINDFFKQSDSIMDKLFPENPLQRLYRQQYGIPKNASGDVSAEIIPKGMTKADLEATNDRKESNKFLQNIDKTLMAINKKPGSAFGTVNIEE